MPDKDYFGSDIKCVKNVQSTQKCQELCQQTFECDKFTYVTSKYTGPDGSTAGRNGCCLKPKKPIKLIDQPNVVSGPKVCPGKSRLILPCAYERK